jgi:hypothetical protein
LVDAEEAGPKLGLKPSWAIRDKPADVDEEHPEDIRQPVAMKR